MRIVARTKDREAVEKFVDTVYHTCSTFSGNTDYHMDHYFIKDFSTGRYVEVAAVTERNGEYILRLTIEK